MTHPSTSRLAQLTHDEDGTTITEFVLLLPVFLLIFIGMINLSSLHHAGLEVNISASKQVWAKALPIQMDQDSNAPAFNYNDAKAASNSNLTGRTDPGSPVRTFMQARWNAGEQNGSLGESHAMLGSVYSQSIDQTELDLNQFHNLGSSSPGMSRLLTLSQQGNTNMQFNGITPDLNSLVTTPMARQLLNDASTGMVSASSNTNGLLGGAQADLSSFNNHTLLAQGAGIRYGSVSSKHARTLMIAGNSFELNANYDVLLAPVAYESQATQQRVHGIARFAMEDQLVYNTLLGIQVDEKVDLTGY